jgi:hypothetical protein
MKTIIQLTPCLMLENNREVNHRYLNYAKDNYGLDDIIIYDQEFKESDFEKDFTYIGNQSKRQGFVKPRNELLKWFYNSDYDYAVWMDADGWITKPTLNDFRTIVSGLKSGLLDVNVISSTMGIFFDDKRMMIHKGNDYFEKVYLLKDNSPKKYIHGMIIRNFKKYYSEEYYITDCGHFDSKGGEDTYFNKMIYKLFNVYLCPTIVISKPSNKFSTWMNEKNGYDYPLEETENMDDYINCNYPEISKAPCPETIKLNRLNDFSIKYLKPYKGRKEKYDPRKIRLF